MLVGQNERESPPLQDVDQIKERRPVAYEIAYSNRVRLPSIALKIGYKFVVRLYWNDAEVRVGSGNSRS